jgi:hypothetical protein
MGSAVTKYSSATRRLAELDQRVMQGLAIYGHPTDEIAIDYLLEPWYPLIDSAINLARLANSRMVRTEVPGPFYLHPIDRDYSIARLDEGSVAMDDFAKVPPTKMSLKARAADYYAEVKKPRYEWRSLDDLESHIREFSLRADAKTTAP